jgi:hypothetical protein
MKKLLLSLLLISCGDENLNTNEFNDLIKSFIDYKCSVNNKEITYETNVYNRQSNYPDTDVYKLEKTIKNEKCEFNNDKIKYIEFSYVDYEYFEYDLTSQEFIKIEEEIDYTRPRELYYKEIFEQKYLNMRDIFLRKENEKINFSIKDHYQKIYDDNIELMNAKNNCADEYYYINQNSIKYCNVLQNFEQLIYRDINYCMIRLMNVNRIIENGGYINFEDYEHAKNFCTNRYNERKEFIETRRLDPCHCTEDYQSDMIIYEF